MFTVQTNSGMFAYRYKYTVIWLKQCRNKALWLYELYEQIVGVGDKLLAQIGVRGGGVRGNSGNARKKTVLFLGSLSLKLL